MTDKKYQEMDRYQLHRYLQNLARLSGKKPCKDCKLFKKKGDK